LPNILWETFIGQFKYLNFEVFMLGKNHTVIAEFSIIPIGQAGTSVGGYVEVAVRVLKKVKGLDFEVTPMGTILAAEDLDTIFEAVRQAHEAIIALGVKRVSSTLRIDDRRDKQRTMEDKLKAVKEYVKKT
jgi:uncharacterized protein (TIGR00106 family)